MQMEGDYLRLYLYNPHGKLGNYQFHPDDMANFGIILRSINEFEKILEQNINLLENSYLSTEDPPYLFFSTFAKEDLFLNKFQDAAIISESVNKFQEWKHDRMRSSYALSFLAQINNYSLIKYLLQHVQEIDFYKIASNETPFFIAAQYNHPESLKAFLSHQKVDPNYARNYDAVTALLIAAQNGFTECASVILGHFKVNPNLANKDGLTPLLAAAQNGFIECVSLILTHFKVNPNLTNKDGMTALMLAEQNGHEEIVKLLLNFSKIDTNIVVSKNKNFVFTNLLKRVQEAMKPKL